MKKATLLFFTIALSLSIRAQDTPSFTFNHLAISVTDVKVSAEFYKSVLSLEEITNRTKLEGIRWFSLGEGKELHLISTIPEQVTLNKAIHLALTTTRFDDFTSKLDKMKIPYSDWPGVAHKVNIRADGIKQIFFQDPDGFWIEVNSVAMAQKK